MLEISSTNGDVLISGMITSLDHSQRKVHSDGEILLKTWYIGKAKVPMQREIPVFTGKKEVDYALKFGNYPIKFRNNGTNFEKYDTIEAREKLKVFQKYEFPIEWISTTYQ